MPEFRIKEIMESRGVTASVLSAKSGLKTEAVASIISGKSDPRAGSLVKIAAALGVPVASLFTESRLPVLICPDCGARINALTGKRP